MVLLGAEFIAMLLVIVYVGAVAVLFLFVVMMLDIDFAELRAGFAPLFAARRCDCGVVLLVEVLLRRRRLEGGRARGSPSAPRRAGPPASRQHRGDGASCSTRAISTCSRSAGLVLLVAMIGAIVLTLRERAGRVVAEHRAGQRPAAAGVKRVAATSSQPTVGQGWSC